MREHRAVFVRAHGERIVRAQRLRERARRPHAPRNRPDHTRRASRGSSACPVCEAAPGPRAPHARPRRDRAGCERSASSTAATSAGWQCVSHALAQRLRFRRRKLPALHEVDFAEPGEIGEAARVVERRLVGDERDVEVVAQAAQQFGDAPRAAVPRRKHGERRDDQQTRPRWPFVVRGAQSVAVRRSAQRDGFAVRSGEPRRRRTAAANARAPAAGETRPTAWPKRASSRWLAYGSSHARAIIHARAKPPMPWRAAKSQRLRSTMRSISSLGIEAGGRHPMLVRGVRPRTEEDAQAIAPGAHAPLGVLPVERVVAAALAHVAA